MSQEHNVPRFEQRLNDLAENTAQTLKIHAGFMVSIDTKLEAIAGQLEATVKRQQATDARVDRLSTKIDQLADIVTSFAQNHENRIQRLEGKGQQ